MNYPVTINAYDKSHNYYFTGYSSSKDFPVTNNANNQSYNGENDIVLIKTDQNFENIEYSTFIGGSHNEGTHLNFKIINDSILYISTFCNSSDFKVNKEFNTFNGGNGMCTLIKMNMKVTSVDISPPIERETIIYPNPAQNILQIEYPDLMQKEAYYKIIDLYGKIVQQDKLIENVIDISRLTKSIYFLNLNINGETINEKIIIE